MLRRNFVPRSHDAALEQRESGFDGIGVNVAHDVTSRAVIDGLVILASGFPHGGDVRNVVIGENDFHIFADILADVLCERARLCIVRVEEPEIAVALADADDHFLVIILGDVAFAAHLAANIGSVHFYFAVEHRLIGLRHCVSDAVAEMPCGLVTANSERALNLAGGNSFLRFAEQVSSGEPLFKRKMSVVENRPGKNGELIAA